jgi:exodeoxyribonuclease VII small subunit
MAKQKIPKSYTEAFDELQEILNRLESEEVNIDKLTDDIKRASALVSFCKEKLRAIDKELNQELMD